MKIVETDIPDLFVIKPLVHNDNRGYFMESYKKSSISETIGAIDFIQENESKSKVHTLRGLHYQKPPFAQTKLIRVIKGSVLDIVVDLRKSSKTFGSKFSIELNEENKKQLLVPKGFAHGFLSLSDDTIFVYKVDEIYNKNYEDGINAFDKDLSIDWGFNKKELNVSEKDMVLQSFSDFISPFR